MRKLYVPFGVFISTVPLRSYSSRIIPDMLFSLLSISDGVITEISTSVLISISNGVITSVAPVIPVDPVAPGVLNMGYLTVYPDGTTPVNSYDFGTLLLTDSFTKYFKIVSTADSTYSVLPTEAGAFTITYGDPLDPAAAPQTILSGQTLRVNISYSSLVPAISNEIVTFLPTGGNEFSINLTGTAVAELPLVPLPRVTAFGNQFISSGVPIRLKGINWFGGETDTRAPHGLWLRNYKNIVAQIAEMGFNCIRLPFSTDGFWDINHIPTNLGALGNAGDPATHLNPELAGLTVYEIFDKIIEACTRNGIYVLLDHHRNSMFGQDGTPIPAGRTIYDWQSVWSLMSYRYADNTTVIGGDLHNEPHNLLWADWKELAENCGNFIHTIAPNWLIFVEGTSGAESDDPFWWGGNLEYVATAPITLTIPNRLVYSPHEYGQSVYLQQWLAYSGNTPANWPLNLNEMRTRHWAFIYEQNIAPVFVGEFGGWFGYDQTGAQTKPHAAEEKIWLANLIDHMNGNYTGTGTATLPGNDLGVSFAYWCLNPDSGDTGGMLQADWTTIITEKLALIDNLLT